MRWNFNEDREKLTSVAEFVNKKAGCYHDHCIPVYKHITHLYNIIL